MHIHQLFRILYTLFVLDTVNVYWWWCIIVCRVITVIVAIIMMLLASFVYYNHVYYVYYYCVLLLLISMCYMYIYIYIHIYVCITIIIFMYITIVSVFVTYSSTIIVRHKYEALHSAKGGAAETGCSGLHSIIGCFTIQHYPHPLHPPPTATPLCRVSRGTIWSILYYTI